MPAILNERVEEDRRRKGDKTGREVYDQSDVEPLPSLPSDQCNVAVVDAALVRVPHHVIGAGNLAKAVGGSRISGVDVRMMLFQ